MVLADASRIRLEDEGKTVENCILLARHIHGIWGSVAAVVVIQQSDNFRSATKRVKEAAKDVAELAEDVLDAGADALAEAGEAAMEAGTATAEVIAEKAGEVAEAIGEAAAQTATTIKDAAIATADAYVNTATTVATAVGETAITAGKSVKANLGSKEFWGCFGGSMKRSTDDVVTGAVAGAIVGGGAGAATGAAIAGGIAIAGSAATCWGDHEQTVEECVAFKATATILQIHKAPIKMAMAGTKMTAKEGTKLAVDGVKATKASSADLVGCALQEEFA